MLRTDDHSRDAAGLRYVYPVLSRRARGLSVGINLNTNNACNWRCIYCQVPGLVRGSPPPVDLDRLRAELQAFLGDVLHGDYLTRHAPALMRRLSDVAFSGNGEPTSAAEFGDAVDAVAEVLERLGLRGRIPLRLITNGSLVDRPRVRRGLARLAQARGEVWFKLDAATAEGLLAINGTRSSPAVSSRRVQLCCGIVPTWLQSCFFCRGDRLPVETEVEAYLGLVRTVAGNLRGVHLYSLARAPMLEEGARLKPVPESWLQELAGRLLRETGLTVTVSP